MDEQLQELVAELHAKCQAYELILIDLLFDAWPLEAHRNERRDSVCRALDHELEVAEPNSHVHLHLQRVLATIEELYDTPGPPSGAAEP